MLAKIMGMKTRSSKRKRVFPRGNMSFWRKIADNPSAAVGILAAFIAAMVGLFTLFINHQDNLHNQRDTQFYEALKRFGDPTSAAVRCSAAGLLAHLGKTTTWPNKRPYFETTLDQLVHGLELEENPVVLNAVSDALEELIVFDPLMALHILCGNNLRLQEEVVVAIADFFASLGANTPEKVHEHDWERAVRVIGYHGHVVRVLANGRECRYLFNRQLSTSPSMYSNAPNDNGKHIAEAQNVLLLAASRLRTNTKFCAIAIRKSRNDRLELPEIFLVEAYLQGARLQKANIIGAHLQGAHLQGAHFDEAHLQGAYLDEAHLQRAHLDEAHLQGAHLQGAHLQEADLRQAHFKGAYLWRAEIDGTTDLDGADWWAADFSYPGKAVDTRLITKLYNRYANEVPNDLSKCHPSVRDFIQKKRQEEP